MRRISHDLPGLTQRLAKLRDTLIEQADETQLAWRDAQAERFFQQHISPVAPTLSGLVSSLTQAIETFESIAKQVHDPDQS